MFSHVFTESGIFFLFRIVLRSCEQNYQQNDQKGRRNKRNYISGFHLYRVGNDHRVSVQVCNPVSADQEPVRVNAVGCARNQRAVVFSRYNLHI